ncbi:hypothetical protein E2986_10687 [Frieseomelitta varia]|uniref:Ig-like domain-containing protein n=1 Tax=Frieseomelitta varia TaxID=561572 RepID=A0A833WBA4_9HYME|nr:hypothetical protein E2986_10687 [Frieseomelitta varia]
MQVVRASCLRNVSLEVVPEVVQRGQKVILRCHYDLENAPLYSLKWYRGRHEFYRYTPSEEPATKVFNITGIYVDDGNSNKSQVTLRDVDFALSGTFSCEVTADAPTFSTAYVSKNLTVVCKYTLHDITEYRGQLDAFNVLVCLPTQRRRSLLTTLAYAPFPPDARDSRVCRRINILFHFSNERISTNIFFVWKKNLSGTYTVNILQQYRDLLYTIIRIVSKDLSAAVENPIYLMESRMHAVELRKVSFISNQSIRDSPCSLLFFVLESLHDNDNDDDNDNALPEGTPIIVSERERYGVGDTLRANCSLPPSKPPAHLSFTLNNAAVSDTYNPRVIIESAVKESP